MSDDFPYQWGFEQNELRATGETDFPLPYADGTPPRKLDWLRPPKPQVSLHVDWILQQLFAKDEEE